MGKCSNAFAIAAKGLKGLHIIAQAEALARGLGKLIKIRGVLKERHKMRSNPINIFHHILF